MFTTATVEAYGCVLQFPITMFGTYVGSKPLILSKTQLVSLFHLHRPDHRQKKGQARSGGASFMGTIN